MCACVCVCVAGFLTEFGGAPNTTAAVDMIDFHFDDLSIQADDGARVDFGQHEFFLDAVECSIELDLVQLDSSLDLSGNDLQME